VVSVRAWWLEEAVSLHTGTVPGDVISKRPQQGREGTVEVVAVAALPISDDPISRLGGVDRRRPPELDLQRLVWHPLDVRSMYGEKTGDRRPTGMSHPEPAEVTVDVNARHQTDGSARVRQTRSMKQARGRSAGQP
jgi:hypothetical protein